MEDDFEEMENLLDDDPALYYILYEDIERENRGGKGGNGCLGVIVLLILPLAAVVICLGGAI